MLPDPGFKCKQVDTELRNLFSFLKNLENSNISIEEMLMALPDETKERTMPN